MKKQILTLCSLICLFNVFGCQKSETPSKQVLNVNFLYEPTILDPRRGSDGVTSTVHFMLFEGLTRMTPTSTRELALAKKIDVSDDGLTYTFFLRESFWSDGYKVTAEDFAFSWTSMLDPSFPCPNAHLLYPIKNAEKIKSGELLTESLGIKVLDEQTFQITLERPTPYFLDLTSFCVLFPVPKHIAASNSHWADTLTPL